MRLFLFHRYSSLVGNQRFALQANMAITLLVLLFVVPSPVTAACRLVSEGEPQSVIILPERPSEIQTLAAQELADHIQLSTGVRIEILSTIESGKIPAGYTRICIGGFPPNCKMNLDDKKLEADQFRIYVGNKIVLISSDNTGGSKGCLWAVYDFLDREIGVRWLWPGKLGTHVPKYKTLSIQSPIDRIGGPLHFPRVFRLWVNNRNADLWLQRHGLQAKSDGKTGHAFQNWWAKYHKTEPGLFAEPPLFYKQPWPGPRRVKLRIGNTAVTEKILNEWRFAGSPNNWVVSPNDGDGWCTSKLSRAMDPPEYKDVSSVDIWNGRVDLTQRYITFWNGILKGMHKTHPNSTITTYAYSVYRDLPENAQLEPGYIVQWVHSYTAYENWNRWRDRGAQLILRPNWFHMGACAPHIPLHAAGNFFKYASRHSMKGFYFDSLLGYWGTQGIYYYLIARLSNRPEMTVDQVIDEYASAFGIAAMKIKEYIKYWENFTDRAAYPVPAGAAVSQGQNGLFEVAARKQRLPLHPLSGGWRLLPVLCPNELTEGAFSLLDEAERLAENDSVVVKERIQFLRKGLTFTIAMRDVMDLVWSKNRKSKVEKEQVTMRIAEMVAMGKKLSEQHVIWWDMVDHSLRKKSVLPDKWQHHIN